MAKKDVTECFSFEVTMLVHIIADSEASAKTQLVDKGGIVTKRDVKLLSAVPLFGDLKENK